MEQITAPHRSTVSSPFRKTGEMSLVDCLFSMPEAADAKRMAPDQKAESARLEARLAAEMRNLIAARLRVQAG